MDEKRTRSLTVSDNWAIVRPEIDDKVGHFGRLLSTGTVIKEMKKKKMKKRDISDLILIFIFSMKTTKNVFSVYKKRRQRQDENERSGKTKILYERYSLIIMN